MLRKITEAGDVLGKLDHLPHSGREAHRKILPDLLDTAPTAPMWVHVHGTCQQNVLGVALPQTVGRCFTFWD